MWPIVLAFGSIAFFLALSGKAKAEKRLPGEPSLALPPPSPPPTPKLLRPSEKCSQEEKIFIANVVKAMQEGRATLSMMRKAHSLALKCLPSTALAIEAQFAKAQEAARAKAVADPAKQLSALIAAPDAPPSPVPRDPKSGKPLWSVMDKRGNKMAIPNFRPVLELFKQLQKLVGAKADGRIGDETVVKFRNLMKSKGFRKFPTTAASLAANVAKYLTVLSQNLQDSQVGSSGGGAVQSPFRHD